MNKKPNIILIISDTLRTAYLGCYGNKNINTPNIDAFAAESTVFDNTYPESLPTIPVRRAMHTGRRAFPFHDYRPLKWSIVDLPGWQAINNDEDTLAENLASSGYYTGFITDTMPYFSPGLNFTRGFWQWEFIRGHASDRWHSIATVPKESLIKYGDPNKILKNGGTEGILRVKANTSHIHSEEDRTTVKVFQWAMDFIDDNRNLQPFYLLIDCFDPHEPWEAPPSYLEMYADPNYNGRIISCVDYGSTKGKYTINEIENIKAHYSGTVTMVDTWFGNSINKLKRLDLWNNSLIIFMSDHGTNFGDNPDQIMGKPEYSLYPGLMHIPMIIHLPNGEAGGQRSSKMVYNIDAVATIYECAGIGTNDKDISIDGKSLKPLIKGSKWKNRKYMTSRYGNTLWYRDNKYWIIIDVTGRVLKVFDLKYDPSCKKNISDNVNGEIIKKAWECILEDAGGNLPDYHNIKETDAIGRQI